jgi:hypothetical protein
MISPSPRNDSLAKDYQALKTPSFRVRSSVFGKATQAATELDPTFIVQLHCLQTSIDVEERLVQLPGCRIGERVQNSSRFLAIPFGFLFGRIEDKSAITTNQERQI